MRLNQHYSPTPFSGQWSYNANFKDALEGRLEQCSVQVKDVSGPTESWLEVDDMYDNQLEKFVVLYPDWQLTKVTTK